MKRFVFLMFAFASLIVSAQGIKNGSDWNVGSENYQATVNADKSITFTAMAEGQELAFRLTPNGKKPNEFTIGEDSCVDGFNPFSKVARVKYIEKQGWKLLCMYDDKGNLQEILDGSIVLDGYVMAVDKWMQQMMGQYVMADGTQVSIGYKEIYVDGETCPFEHVNFNDCVTGIIQVEGGNRFNGLHEVVLTLDGAVLYEVESDEYGFFKRKGHKDVLKWVDNEPRFGYANFLLLNDKRFRLLKKSTLRVMRNSILAKHGYMFSSPDLVKYFGSKPWFTPRPSNDDINESLSLVEKLNIELIKTEENNPEHNDFVKEP